MSDDVLTRNANKELALRVSVSSGDTGLNKNDVYTRDSQGRLAVRTVGGSGGGSGGASSASDLAMTPVVGIDATNVQDGMGIVGSDLVSLKDISNKASILRGDLD